MDRHIPDVCFIDHSICHRTACMGIRVMLPTFRVGGSKIEHHGAVAIHTDRAGIGVAGFHRLAITGNLISIVNTVQIAADLRSPCTGNIPMHGNLLQRITDSRVTAGV